MIHFAASLCVTGLLVGGCGTGEVAHQEGDGGVADLRPPDAAPATSDLSPPSDLAVRRAPSHILTADNCCELDGQSFYATSRVPSFAAIAPYLDWAALMPADNTAAMHAAGIKGYVYTDPHRAYSSDNDLAYQDIMTTNAAAEAKDCNGAVIVWPAYGGTGLLTDPRVNPSQPNLPGAGAHAKVLVDQVNASLNGTGQSWDAIFFDDTDDLYSINPLPCNATKQSWTDAEAKLLAAAAPTPIIFNGALDPFDDQGFARHLALLDVPNVRGAMFEDCYGESSNPTFLTDRIWQNAEDGELQAVAKRKQFWCFAIGDSSVAGRMFIYASLILTYDLDYTVLIEPTLAPNAGSTAGHVNWIRVPPEAWLVPTEPLVPQPKTVSELRDAGGAYFREYARCYYQGNDPRPCAVVVNSSSSSVPWPTLSRAYGHTMTISGPGAMGEAGVSLGFVGPAPPATIPAMTSGMNPPVTAFIAIP